MAKTAKGIEIDEDRAHQRREWRIERVGWVAMAALVLAALLGLLGDGPIGETTAGTRDALRVEYNRLQRAAAPTEYRFAVQPALARDGRVRLRLEDALLEEVHLRAIVPEPASTRAGPGYTEFTFDVGAGDSPARIVFDFEPTSFGRVTGRVVAEGAPPITLDQFVFP